MMSTIPELYTRYQQNEIHPWDQNTILKVARLLPAQQSEIFFLLVYHGCGQQLTACTLMDQAVSINLRELPIEIYGVLTAFLSDIGAVDNSL